MKRYRGPLVYAAVSAFVLLFGLIYTANSYGVTSVFMSFAFMPTALTALWLFYLASREAFKPTGHSNMALAFFNASLTVYSILKGVLAIAGAYSYYDVMPLYLAIVSGISFCVLYYVQYRKHKKEGDSHEKH